MAENATLFLTYNRAQEFFKSSGYFRSSTSDRLSITGLVVAGGIAGACTSYVLTPIELVKCKLQVQNVGSYTPGTTTFPATASTLKKGAIPTPSAAIHTSTKVAQPGPVQLIRQILRAQGITGLWRGQMGTFLRESGGSAAWFGTYEYVSSLLKAHRRHDDVSAQDLMFSGACAGMAYNLVLFPADSIKSRMQTDAISDVRVHRGFWAVGKSMWRYGGISIFYRGCLITVLRAAPASAVIFWTYESLKKIAQ
jgi:mitochondrial ornithine carrier protein